MRHSIHHSTTSQHNPTPTGVATATTTIHNSAWYSVRYSAACGINNGLAMNKTPEHGALKLRDVEGFAHALVLASLCEQFTADDVSWLIQKVSKTVAAAHRIPPSFLNGFATPNWSVSGRNKRANPQVTLRATPKRVTSPGHRTREALTTANPMRIHAIACRSVCYQCTYRTQIGEPHAIPSSAWCTRT